MPSVTGPKKQIRRFDIFAEWNRLKGSEKLKLRAGDARAYGLAVAKVVAGRKQKREAGKEPGSDKQTESDQPKSTKEQQDERWWEHLGSDAEFKRVIVQRMGGSFYKGVFAPAVRKAWDSGKDYTNIRDTLRTPWNKRVEKSKVKRAPRSHKS